MQITLLALALMIALRILLLPVLIAARYGTWHPKPPLPAKEQAAALMLFVAVEIPVFIALRYWFAQGSDIAALLVFVLSGISLAQAISTLRTDGPNVIHLDALFALLGLYGLIQIYAMGGG